jgi:AraC-like DNA-binding protein
MSNWSEVAPALRSRVESVGFSTEDLEARHQFDAFEAFVTPSYEISPIVDRSLGFKMKRKAVRFGNMMLLSQMRDEFEAARGAENIRRDQNDTFIIDCRLSGACLMESDDEDYEIAPGTLLIRGMDRPVRTRTEAGRLVQLVAPREVMRAMIGNVDPLGFYKSSAGMSRLLTDYMISMSRRIDDIAADQAPKLAEVAQLLLLAALAPSRDHWAQAAAPINDLLRARAMRHIERHLMAPDLTPDAIALTLGVSRRKLYQVFEADGGVARQILRLRLERARAALADPRRSVRVREAAFSHGFESEAHFCRSFKKLFGLTPTEAVLLDRAAGVDEPAAGAG